MSDEQTLLAVIAAIYLADCIYWIPRDGLGVTQWVSAFWRIHFPSPLLGNDRGAISFAHPFPPLGLAIRTQGWPVAMSPRGISSFDWSQIKRIEREDKKILMNGGILCICPSGYAARRVVETIVRLGKLESRQREQELGRLIEESCDWAAIRKRVDEFKAETRKLNLLCNLLFFFLFGACPYMVWKLGMTGAIWPVVLGIYLQTILIATVFIRTHQRLYPQDSEQILKPCLTMLLAAPSAIRAQDVLGRPLLESRHPLAVAKALCREEAFKKVAPGITRDLKYPRLPVSETELTFRSLVLKALGMEELIEPPVASEAANTKYCPRCLQQFTAAGTTCRDCGERELVPFQS